MSKLEKYVATEVDGNKLNARHYSAMSRSDAIKALQADFASKKEINTDWAGKAYDKMTAEVKQRDSDLAAEKAKADKKAIAKAAVPIPDPAPATTSTP